MNELWTEFVASVSCENMTLIQSDVCLLPRQAKTRVLPNKHHKKNCSAKSCEGPPLERGDNIISLSNASLLFTWSITNLSMILLLSVICVWINTIAMCNKNLLQNFIQTPGCWNTRLIVDRTGRGGGFYPVLSVAVTFYDSQICWNVRRVLSS